MVNGRVFVYNKLVTKLRDRKGIQICRVPTRLSFYSQYFFTKKSRNFNIEPTCDFLS